MGDLRGRRRVVLGRVRSVSPARTDSTRKSAEGAAVCGRRLLPDRRPDSRRRPVGAGRFVGVQHGRDHPRDDRRRARRRRRRVHHLGVQVRWPARVRDAARVRRRADRQRAAGHDAAPAEVGHQPDRVPRLRAGVDRRPRKWKVEVGLGYSTPILIGNRLYMYSRQSDNEVLTAVEAETGKTIWQSSYAAPFTMNPAAARHEKGPKSTPTFANGRLYTLGMSGIVTAFDATTGKQLWQKPASPVGPLYGTAMSPLVDRGLVIVHVGGHNQGALTAFEATTGDVKWRWTGDGPSYGSPIAAEFDGTRQVIVFTQ